MRFCFQAITFDEVSQRCATADVSCSSDVCLGTMTWGVQNTEAEAHEQLSYALDSGINFLDTAEVTRAA